MNTADVDDWFGACLTQRYRNDLFAVTLFHNYKGLRFRVFIASLTLPAALTV